MIQFVLTQCTMLLSANWQCWWACDWDVSSGRSTICRKKILYINDVYLYCHKAFHLSPIPWPKDESFVLSQLFFLLPSPHHPLPSPLPFPSSFLLHDLLSSVINHMTVGVSFPLDILLLLLSPSPMFWPRAPPISLEPESGKSIPMGLDTGSLELEVGMGSSGMMPSKIVSSWKALLLGLIPGSESVHSGKMSGRSSYPIFTMVIWPSSNE